MGKSGPGKGPETEQTRLHAVGHRWLYVYQLIRKESMEYRYGVNGLMFLIVREAGDPQRHIARPSGRATKQQQPRRPAPGRGPQRQTHSREVPRYLTL